MEDAKCDCPAFKEGMRTVESKFNAAVVNDHKLDDA
jgi:hypothetical protein